MSAENDIDRVILKQFFANDGAMSRAGDWLGRRRMIVDVGTARPDRISISAGFRSRACKVLSSRTLSFCEANLQMGYKIYQFAYSVDGSGDHDFTVIDSYRPNYDGGAASEANFSSLVIEVNIADLPETVRDKNLAETTRLRKGLDTILRRHEPLIAALTSLQSSWKDWRLGDLGFSIERCRPSAVILEHPSEISLTKTRWTRGVTSCGGVWPNDVYIRTG